MPARSTNVRYCVSKAQAYVAGSRCGSIVQELTHSLQQWLPITSPALAYEPAA